MREGRRKEIHVHLPVFCSSIKIFPSLSSCTCISLDIDSVHVRVHDGTYRVMLRIVKAGCHPVAIAQVVEH